MCAAGPFELRRCCFLRGCMVTHQKRSGLRSPSVSQMLTAVGFSMRKRTKWLQEEENTRAAEVVVRVLVLLCQLKIVSPTTD